ncbi:MAG: ornithine cyclodeaminase family protein [Verrucomicrobiota bacterium]|nr:ornithine cyclodeaminase family protein [Verrucomicrobiota bacterium]
MQFERTMLLHRSDVAELLSLQECIDAVERIFRLQGEGKVPASKILGLNAPRGGLHIKAGLLPGDRSYVVAKANTNFPENAQRFGLPTIQGLIIVYDAENGFPLAVLDSMDVTVKRTAAASAVAAKYLAQKNSSVGTICGCGLQGRAQLRAMLTVLPLKKIYVYDLAERAAKSFVTELADELKLEIEAVHDLPDAIQNSDICVTCTPSRKFIVHKKDVSPGTFIAAVGADNEHKQEIDPALMASSKVVVDSLEQCASIGDLHHAISQDLMRQENVYAELDEIVAGQKPGRASEEEIIIFDSTGVAIEDAITAAAVYEKARAAHVGDYFNFAG